jgi:hypothetical protein
MRPCYCATICYVQAYKYRDPNALDDHGRAASASFSGGAKASFSLPGRTAAGEKESSKKGALSRAREAARNLHLF